MGSHSLTWPKNWATNGKLCQLTTRSNMKIWLRRPKKRHSRQWRNMRIKGKNTRRASVHGRRIVKHAGKNAKLPKPRPRKMARNLSTTKMKRQRSEEEKGNSARTRRKKRRARASPKTK